jgi:hypothetical protein
LQGNKSLPATKTFQVAKLAGKFPFIKKENVSSKNRPETCLFSFGNSRAPKRVHLHPGEGKSFPISRGMLWHEHPSPTMAKFDESVPKKVEISRFSVLDIPGRHFIGGKLPPDGKKEFTNHVAGLKKILEWWSTRKSPN